MVLKSIYPLARHIGPLGQERLPLIQGPGPMVQVSLRIDGASRGAAKGYFAISYDGLPAVPYPSPADLSFVQGETHYGASRMEARKAPGAWSNNFQYYVKLLSPFNVAAEVILHNLDATHAANFYCIILYEGL